MPTLPDSVSPGPAQAPHAAGAARRLIVAAALIAAVLILALCATSLAALGVFRAEGAADRDEAAIASARTAVLEATALAYPADVELVHDAGESGLQLGYVEAVELGAPLETTRAALLDRRRAAEDPGEIARIDAAVAAIDRVGAAVKSAQGAPPGPGVAATVIPAVARSREPIAEWVTYSDRLLWRARLARADRRARDFLVVSGALAVCLLSGALLLLRLRASVRAWDIALREAAMTDALTGLQNREAFDGRLAEEVARCRRSGAPLSLVLLDIDHFRRVNDAYGDRAGDAMLEGIGAALAGAARKEDLVARLGGEKFAWVAVDSDGDGAMVVAGRARAAIAAVHVQGVCGVTASAGVAERGPEESAGDLVRRAEEALYQAKSGGRDRVFRAGAGVMAGARLPTTGVIRAP